MTEQKQTAFKQTEVGEIPEDWKEKNLSDICSMKSGETITSKNISDIGLYPCFGGNGLRGYTSRYTHEGEFTLIGRQGALCGNVQFVSAKFFASEHAVVVTPKINTNIKWLFYVLTDMNLNQYSESSAQPGLSVSKILSLPVPLPPTLAEQTAIATALSDADALISQLETLIAKKKAIKQGAMQELLRPKEGWEVKPLGEVGTFKNGINKSSSDFGHGYPFINLLDVFGRTKIESSRSLGLINSNEAERKLYDLREGDVVFIRSSVKPEGVGLTCVIKKSLLDTVFSGFIIRFRDKGILSTEFKEYCFSTEDFRSRLLANSTVSANTNINQEALKNLILYFPSDKTEQTRIARILSDMDAEIEKLEQRLAKQKQLKQGLMQVLLTGKIRLV